MERVGPEVPDGLSDRGGEPRPELRQSQRSRNLRESQEVPGLDNQGEVKVIVSSTMTIELFRVDK